MYDFKSLIVYVLRTFKVPYHNACGNELNCLKNKPLKL